MLCNCVVSANTINTFKTRLDRPKFWLNQDIIYNLRALLQGPEVVASFSTKNLSKENIVTWTDKAGMRDLTCARKFPLYVYVSPQRPAFSGNSTQLQWHDSVHLPSVYTDYSFSSLNLKLRHDIGLYVTETTAKCGLCNVRIFNILLKILMGTLEIQERKMPEESDSSQVYVYRASIFTRTPQSKPPIEAAVIRVCFPCSTSPSTTPTVIDTFLNSLVILTVV